MNNQLLPDLAARELCLSALQHTRPAKLPDYLLQKVPVPHGDGHRDGLSLVFALCQKNSIQIILSLKVHPHIGRNTQSLLQSNGHIQRHRTLAGNGLAYHRRLDPGHLRQPLLGQSPGPKFIPYQFTRMGGNS